MRVGRAITALRRRVVPACLAGCVVLLLAACASPPDLTALAGSRSSAPAGASPTDAHASSGGSSPHGGTSSGASTGTDTTPAPEWTNTVPAQRPEASGSSSGATTSGRGWIQRAGDHPGRDITLGENVDLSEEPGYPDIAVTIARVTRNATCPQGPPPRLGQYVALDLIVRRTKPNHDIVGITTFEWVALGPDGTATKTYGLSGFLCQRATEQFPLRFGDRDEVRGQLILDVPTDTVTVTATIPWDQRAARLLIPVRQPD